MDWVLSFLIFSRSSSGFSVYKSWKSEMNSRSVEHKITASWILSLFRVGETDCVLRRVSKVFVGLHCSLFSEWVWELFESSGWGWRREETGREWKGKRRDDMLDDLVEVLEENGFVGGGLVLGRRIFQLGLLLGLGFWCFKMFFGLVFSTVPSLNVQCHIGGGFLWS